ncbi:MAG: tyrosine-protein phosphatase [Gemmataceae bacterium]
MAKEVCPSLPPRPLPPLVRWGMGVGIALFIVLVPFVYYRFSYSTHKRLRVVSAGKVYRSGCMTEAGFRDAVEKLGIRTVINLQDEWPDPEISRAYFSLGTVKESEMCKELGVEYVFLPVDLIAPGDVPHKHPVAIDRFRAIMDDPASYPVLIHCRAGLHRTGCLSAVYRQEYEGWTSEEALAELKAHGFGEFVSSWANDYIMQYIVAYQPRPRGSDGALLAAPRRAVTATPVSRTMDDYRRLPKGAEREP